MNYDPNSINRRHAYMVSPPNGRQNSVSAIKYWKKMYNILGMEMLPGKRKK